MTKDFFKYYIYYISVLLIVTYLMMKWIHWYVFYIYLNIFAFGVKTYFFFFVMNLYIKSVLHNFWNF